MGSLLRVTRQTLQACYSRNFLLGIVLCVVTLSSDFAMAAENNFSPILGNSAPYVITIKGVYLKDGMGEWVKVIEPDRRVDLSQEEPVVTFFNNGGRVPAGEYQNFRVDYLSAEGGSAKLFSKEDFKKAVAVHKGSFVRVAFNLGLEKNITVKKADLTVDEDHRSLLSDSLTLEV